MRNNAEYTLCKQIAAYLRIKYPTVVFHFDLAGLNLSRAQAGMTKAIQGGKGWPDLFIAKPRISTDPDCYYAGLFIELKAEGTRLYKRDNTYATPHLQEQGEMMSKLFRAGYYCKFAVGYNEAVRIIDKYLT